MGGTGAALPQHHGSTGQTEKYADCFESIDHPFVLCKSTRQRLSKKEGKVFGERVMQSTTLGKKKVTRTNMMGHG